jgi:predicted ATPase
MAQLGDAFVGRDGELGQLVTTLEGLSAGTATFVAVTGESGIGKTRLLSEFGRITMERNCLTVTGHASEFERDYPFGLFVDAFDSYLATLDDRLLAVFPSMRSIDHAVDRRTSTSPTGVLLCVYPPGETPPMPEWEG